MDKDDIDNWELVQNCVNNINHFLDRLTKEDNDWKKMPRFRDFPFNGVEFLKMYKASIIDKMIKAIKDEQDTILSLKGKMMSKLIWTIGNKYRLYLAILKI